MGDLLTPIDLGTDKTAVQIAAGQYSTCALLNDGAVKCWGYNDEGQLSQASKLSLGGAPGEMGEL